MWSCRYDPLLLMVLLHFYLPLPTVAGRKYSTVSWELLTNLRYKANWCSHHSLWHSVTLPGTCAATGLLRAQRSSEEEQDRAEQSRALCARCLYDHHLPRLYFYDSVHFSKRILIFPDFPECRRKKALCSKSSVAPGDIWVVSCLANEESFATAVGSKPPPTHPKK